MNENCKLGVVGPCASGKSTLIASLNKYGYNARHIAQEHSYVPTMWRRITDPDVLIFLDVSYELSKQRRKLNWTEAEYAEQHHRLRDARLHADLYVDTNNLTIEQVLQRVLDFLEKDRVCLGNKVI